MKHLPVREFCALVQEVMAIARESRIWLFIALLFSSAGSLAAPPTAPGNLHAYNGPTYVVLGWTAATDVDGYVMGYYIERCAGVGCSNFQPYGSTDFTESNFFDTAVQPGTSYSYRVRALDYSTTFGPYSNVTTADRSGDTVPPTAPSNLTVTSSSVSQVGLSWTASSDNVGVNHYRIQRCTGVGCSNFASASGISASTTYTDTAAAGTTYNYRVQAVDNASNPSGPSNVVTATTEPSTLSAPSNLSAVAVSGSRIDLTWTASTGEPPVSQYYVERCQGAGCSNFAFVTVTYPPTTSYSNTGLAPETSYSYRVRAWGSYTYSEYSAVASATTSPLVQAQLYFVHVDHLNTPRLVADAAGTTVWRWDQQEPFGVNVPDENPSGLGAFEMPLRFPGQYADKETNLHYNMARDYDPGIGRYVQSDPTGLIGGPNTYIYVLQHPLAFTDPSGLITGAGAYRHYCFGKGATITISYSDVGVTGVHATSFSSVAVVKGMPCVSAVIAISDSKPYTTTGEIFAVLGDVTLRLNGILYTSCECSWTFMGTLTVADDFYNFNRSTHRSLGAEAATTLGRLGGKVCGATPYTIRISGGQPVSESGRINGTPTCCGP